MQDIIKGTMLQIMKFATQTVLHMTTNLIAIEISIKQAIGILYISFHSHDELLV